MTTINIDLNEYIGSVLLHIENNVIETELSFNVSSGDVILSNETLSGFNVNDVLSWEFVNESNKPCLIVQLSTVTFRFYELEDTTIENLVEVFGWGEQYGELSDELSDVSSSSDLVIDMEKIKIQKSKMSVNRKRNLSFSVSTRNSIAKKKNHTRKYFTVDLKIYGAKGLKLSKQSHSLKVIASIEGNVWKTGSIRNNVEPLWEEEFSGKIEILNNLNLYVLDNRRIVGSVSINPENFCDTEPKEEWYNLSSCKRRNFVTGELIVIISTNHPKEYFVTIFQAKNLSLLNVTNDSVSVTVEYAGNTKKSKTGKSVNFLPNVIWKENNVFSFKKKFSGQRMKFTVNGVGKLGKTIFLGEAYFSISECKDLEKEEKLILLPRDSYLQKDLKKSGDLKKTGSLRVKMALKKKKVRQLSCYKDFSEFLFKDPVGLISILEQISLNEDRVKLATTLVNIFEAKNKAPIVLNALITHETQFQSGIDTLFRGNTVGSAAIDIYMRYTGHNYLLEVVRPLVKQIYKEKKLLEIRPDFLEKPEDLEKNIKIISKYIDSFLETIFTDHKHLPNSLKKVFFHLANELEKKFPEEVDIKYIGISGFLFLRLIVAAINSPKLFDIMNENPNPVNAKNLTTIAKIILKISSMVDMSDEEPSELNSIISDHQPRMREFLDIASYPLDELDFNPVPVDMAEELAFLLDYLQNSVPKMRDILSRSYETEQFEILESLFSILDDFGRGSNRVNLKSRNVSVSREFTSSKERIMASVSSPVVNITSLGSL